MGDLSGATKQSAAKGKSKLDSACSRDCYHHVAPGRHTPSKNLKIRQRESNESRKPSFLLGFQKSL